MSPLRDPEGSIKNAGLDLLHYMFFFPNFFEVTLPNPYKQYILNGVTKLQNGKKNLPKRFANFRFV